MRFLKGLGIIIGLMFGAGVFGLPFVVAKAGILWGSIHMILALAIMIFSLFLYAKVIYGIEGKHRFTGYVGLVLGEKAKVVSFFVTVLAYYGSLLIYGVLGGLFLSSLLGGFSPLIMSSLFFVIGAIICYLKLEKMAMINFYLTIPLFGFVVYLFLSALSFVDLSNFQFSLNSFSNAGAWFLPYGVWLFSFGAFGAIPETKDVFSGAPLKSFKKVILVSLLLCAAAYCLFVFSIIGVSGLGTTEDALSGVLVVMPQAALMGSVMGILAVFTSFLALGVDLRDVYRYDFGFSKKIAWFLAITPPIILYWLGFQDFTRILSFVGVIGVGVVGILIILMGRKVLKKVGVGWIVGGGVLAAVVYELYNLLF